MKYDFNNIRKGYIFYIPKTDFEKRISIIDYDNSYVYYIDLNTNYSKLFSKLVTIGKITYNELNSKWVKE